MIKFFVFYYLKKKKIKIEDKIEVNKQKRKKNIYINKRDIQAQGDKEKERGEYFFLMRKIVLYFLLPSGASARSNKDILGHHIVTNSIPK